MRAPARPHRRTSARARAFGRSAGAAGDGAAALSEPASADPRSVGPAGRHHRREAWPCPRRSRSAPWRWASPAPRAGLRLPINDSFAGFSNFDVSEPYADELQSALSQPGRRHIVMCHPGHPDAELAGLDPVVERRRMEYDALMRDPGLPARIWRPSRSADGPPLAWAAAGCRTERWPDRRNRLVPGGQHPLRHGLGFLVSGGTAFAVDALVLKLLTAAAGTSSHRRAARRRSRSPWSPAG